MATIVTIADVPDGSSTYTVLGTNTIIADANGAPITTYTPPATVHIDSSNSVSATTSTNGGIAPGQGHPEPAITVTETGTDQNGRTITALSSRTLSNTLFVEIPSGYTPPPSLSSTSASVSSPSAMTSNQTQTGSSLSSTATNGTSTNGTLHHTSSPSKGDVSSGVLAGAIVAALVGGFLIALLAACFFFRRKSKLTGGGAFIEEKTLAHPWDAYLPQSADDGTTRNQVQSLFGQIDMHVENYYSNKRATGAPSAELLTKVNSPHLPDSIATLLATTSTPTPIIKHVFAWVILTQLSPAKQGEPSLLPPEFARMPPQLAVAGQKKGGAREDQATPQAYKYWRVLTGHLMYPKSSKRSIDLNNIPSAKDSVDTLSEAFAPWSKERDAGREHLINVIKSASETGLLLMSQPSSFDFEWYNDSPKGSSNVSTFPALEKTADERGTGLQQRQTLIKSRVERIYS